MRNVLDCINAFIPLLSTEYELVLGRKGVAVTINKNNIFLHKSFGLTIQMAIFYPLPIMLKRYYQRHRSNFIPSVSR